MALENQKYAMDSPCSKMVRDAAKKVIQDARPTTKVKERRICFWPSDTGQVYTPQDIVAYNKRIKMVKAQEKADAKAKKLRDQNERKRTRDVDRAAKREVKQLETEHKCHIREAERREKLRKKGMLLQGVFFYPSNRNSLCFMCTL